MGIAAASAETESVIRPRPAQDGGPFMTLACPRCRTESGALRNRRGEWLLYPLEGAEEPSVLERLVPVKSREHLDRARAWWVRHAADVERFRRAGRADAPADADTRATPPPVTSSARPRSARHEILDVAADASLADVRRAWRAAVKRWHPDRVPSGDPVVVEEAHRRFAELRRAYESLVAELSAPR